MSVYGQRRCQVVATAIGDTPLIVGVPNKRLVVVGGIISARGGVNDIEIDNDSDESLIFGFNLAANQVVVMPFHDNWEMGYFTGKVGSGLEVSCSAATAVHIALVAYAVN
jgi:hypothetical protein